jgi:radical SAM/Cys-rich protein
MLETVSLLKNTDFPPVKRRKLETVQANLGYRCNQQCVHCHVNAGPRRSETMSVETAEEVMAFTLQSGASNLDLTGGAPELNQVFRPMVRQARSAGLHVIDRCNLTVLFEPGQEDLADFLAGNRVEIIASLPCYQPENVDGQRGKGVFERSIEALLLLNEKGYGSDPSRPLNLVYNPQGPNLPPPQPALEADYRRRLWDRYRIRFSRLFTIANMPIQRFGSTLLSKGRFNEYMALLRGAHQADNLEHLMCRSLISIDWRGYVYDCDFNQMLALPAEHRRAHSTAALHVRELGSEPLAGRDIVVGEHCYGCTAGQGSSCGGALG